MPSLDVDTAVAQIAEGLEASVDALTDEIMVQIYDRWKELDESARVQLGEPMRRSAHANLRAVLSRLTRLRGDEPFQAPIEALEEARIAARTGFPLSDLLATYQLGHLVVWERALEIAAELPAAEDVRTEALRFTSRAGFAYTDQICQAISEAFQLERDAHMHRSSQRHVQLVRDVLEGANVDGTRLGYDLHRSHVAIVASGSESGAVVQSLGRSLGIPPLTVTASDAATWAWFALESVDELRRLAVAGLGEGVRIGIGDARRGPQGFRQSHREALAACSVAERVGSAAEQYDEIALEAIALIDEQAARRFVQRELKALAEDDERNRRLRATMHAYLRTAHNASASAALLGINDRTVAYRVRTCEDLLGRPVSVRAAELETALRWGRVLGLFSLDDAVG